MGDWQPIETAPKDGTEIILFGPYPENKDGLPTDRVTAGFWCVPEPPVIGDCGGECRCRAPLHDLPLEASPVSTPLRYNNSRGMADMEVAGGLTERSGLAVRIGADFCV